MARELPTELQNLVIDVVALSDEQAVCVGRPVSYYEAHDPEHWLGSTAYAVGDSVRPTTRDGYVHECTVAGTSDVSEPTWSNVPGNTTTDGATLVWTCRLHRAKINVDMVSGDFTKSDGTYGRRVDIAAKNDNTVHSSGVSIDHIALLRASDHALKLITTCAVKDVSQGNLESITTWAYEFDDPIAFP